MEENELAKRDKAFLQEFNTDSRIVGEQVVEFLRLVYPAYLVDKTDLEPLMDSESTLRLESMSFFRISSCTADNVEKVFENVNEHFEKLFTALYSINIPVAYGIVSRDGVTNLVIGVYQSAHVNSVKTIMQGMLSGIELNGVKPCFKCEFKTHASHGILAGVPSLFVNGQKQIFSLSSIMRSLNGQNYTLLFIAKPVKQDVISQNISELISVRDKAFAVSKRNVARTNSYSETTTNANTVNDSKNSVAGQVGGGAGAGLGAVAGALVGTFLLPGLGTMAGIGLGGALGGGLGTVIGNIVGQGKTHSEGYSESISKAITEGDTVSGDIQNGFALELMNYADNAIDRLKGGQNNGIWQTAIVYSAESEMARNIIRACLSGELSKLDSEKLPMLAFEPVCVGDELLRIPNFLEGDQHNSLCSYLNSAELGLLCTVPTESVPDFELRLEKKFPLIASRMAEDNIVVGNVIDGKNVLENMPFRLSDKDLNKHTFVCGITGSGKTTTVKKILIEAKKPFLVIESAKKEYRNISIDTEVYTLGKPEINAPQINPFYIMPGVSPQVHIDYLKDLFNASFSFYGPMTYILEKCLHVVYKNKGWDLTLGYHPLLANSKSPTDFFNIEHTKKQYSFSSHKFLFPTMQELKDEIARYIDEELKYDGEVAGNVKTAMKVRLENLCVGAKGYTFNTSEFVNFDSLLSKNVIFELEGLADDSDKAFGVGLLIIFINEYRQVKKEISGNQNAGLQHLLVIEEAHRLLKNVDTDRSTETSGNPKGKAVEHFTNMIAEMRSYGQGVVVAEQIPTKLAPDVIKNSSTKIVQRIVSVDDQQAIANTIGIAEKDAIQLGSLETGLAYCHKEGMLLPAPVKIADYYLDEKGNKLDLDVFVSDEQLYNSKIDRFEEINLSVLWSCFGGNQQMKINALRFINSLMVLDEKSCMEACKSIMTYVANEIRVNDIQLTLMKDASRIGAKLITEIILTLMVRGVYRTSVLPDDKFISIVEQTLYAPSVEKILQIKNTLRLLYTKELEKYAKINVAALVKRSQKENTDILATVKGYFYCISENMVDEISKMVKGEWSL
ncbi:MAG: ATP-binding protein [Lachnospiraceae bacterium]|nr:ATP-binding protein [Lachnospiraceae bacterium]